MTNGDICTCDVCGRQIFRVPRDNEPSRIVKFWKISVGEFIENRKIPRDTFDVCSMQCYEDITRSLEGDLMNPFNETYMEMAPIKVFGAEE